MYTIEKSSKHSTEAYNFLREEDMSEFVIHFLLMVIIYCA
jgi:hypothetical protein